MRAHLVFSLGLLDSHGSLHAGGWAAAGLPTQPEPRQYACKTTRADRCQCRSMPRYFLLTSQLNHRCTRAPVLQLKIRQGKTNSLQSTITRGQSGLRSLQQTHRTSVNNASISQESNAHSPHHHSWSVWFPWHGPHAQECAAAGLLVQPPPHRVDMCMIGRTIGTYG